MLTPRSLPFQGIVKWLEVRADQDVLVRPGRIGDVIDLAGILIKGGDAAADAHLSPADADEHFAFHDKWCGGRCFAEIDLARLRRPLLLAGLRIEGHDMIIERDKEDLAAVIGDAACDDVTAGDALSRAILVWNVSPFQVAGRRVERKDFVRIGADNVQGVADDERRCLLSALGSD